MKILTTHPDYYSKFQCKCGNCRNICCSGWNITLTQDEYYHLIGLNCKKELRKRLDCSFRIADNPEHSRYAQINMNYIGNCPILDEQGYCSLQRNCGENALPSVCRIYPREIRNGLRQSACTSLSCEETIELLIETNKPISIITSELDLPFNGLPSLIDTDDKLHIHDKCIQIISNRAFSLKNRFNLLADYLSVEYSENKSTLKSALLYMNGLFESLKLSSKSIDLCLAYSEEEKKRFEESVYSESAAKADSACPDMAYYLEKIIINHMLYEEFPFTTPDISIKSAYIHLCIAYVLTKMTFIYAVADSENKQCATDAIACLYRFLEHTDYYNSKFRQKTALGEDLITVISVLF